jgi:P27 family predicted phage terminase small subunit
MVARQVGGGGGTPVTIDPFAEPPPCPKDIPPGTIGRRYWKLYWEAAKNWLAKADVPMVERLCRLWNLSEDIYQAIMQDDLIMGVERTRRSVVVQETPDGPVSEDVKKGPARRVHPMLIDYQRVVSQIERIEDRLGLSPVERSRIRLQVKESASALDRWRAGRSG